MRIKLTVTALLFLLANGTPVVRSFNRNLNSTAPIAVPADVQGKRIAWWLRALRISLEEAYQTILRISKHMTRSSIGRPLADTNGFSGVELRKYPYVFRRD